jgi:hypothetical protein
LLVIILTEMWRKIMSAQRMLFLTVAVLYGVGIFLSGWQQVHWFLYLPTVMLVFAGITGICPGLMLYQKMGLK